MTDFNPTPPAAEPGNTHLSVEDILAIERKLRENRAAQHRGEPLPHVVSREEMRMAVQAIRRQRGTMNLQAPTSGKKASGGAKSIIQVDLEGL